MKTLEDVKSILRRMQELLSDSDEHEWATAIQASYQWIGDSPPDIKEKLIRMFGGSGSLNDIVLYKNGIPDKSNNEEFGKLRFALHKLCRESNDGSEATK